MSGPARNRPAEVKFTDADLDAVAADGSFCGYASLFDVPDLSGDVVAPGAFAASLARRGAGGVRTLADIGRDFTWRYGPANRDVSEAIYAEQVFAPVGTALLPRSPVHLAAARDEGSGDTALTWIRRTRVPGERWDEIEEPLGETSEAYRLTIYGSDGETVLRQTETQAPAYTYTAAQAAADFGSPPASLMFGVAQLGETLGAGTEARATFAL